jgi:hypothetical protein
MITLGIIEWVINSRWLLSFANLEKNTSKSQMKENRMIKENSIRVKLKK